jgi:bifunctional polynucleotide phosphatase/kinase
MWQLFLNKYNGKVEIDKKTSFYCGDAAGRRDAKHKDFSDSDLKFALNVGIEFKTPENLFLGEKDKIEVKGFNPTTVPEEGELIVGKGSKVDFQPKEMVLMVGAPGSGKSTFCKNFLPGYIRVNRDTLKTKEKCYKVAEENILQGKSVVIDNTNPKKEDRRYFIDLAKKHGLKVRCF